MRKNLFPLAVYIFLVLTLFWRCVFLGEAFVPLGQLSYVLPWSSDVPPEERHAWNPLHYDSVGQYWVFRDFATSSLRAGRLPLWNPYQFCGTPFIANNLSAVYYPGNLLHLLLGTDRALGWNAALHLIFAAWFTFLLVRRLGYSDDAAMLAGLIYGFSLWQVTWLHLPPFVATSAWLPALCLALIRLREKTTAPRTAVTGIVVGLVLLAGHLQIAFYVLAAATVFALWLLWREPSSRSRFIVCGVTASCVGLCLAAPQLLPTMELARYAHRVAAATPEGYAAYIGYAVHPAALVTLFLPDFFGNPALADAPYSGFSRSGAYFNYAEGALYVGLAPFVLVAVGMLKIRNEWRTLLPIGIAAAALLLGLGTPLAAVLYFGVPGFAGSGSPGRVFVLWTFAAAWLVAAGWDHLTQAKGRFREVAWPMVVVLTAWGVSALYASTVCHSVLGGVPATVHEAVRQALLFALGALALFLTVTPSRRRMGQMLLIAVTAVDLLAHGVPYNATGRPETIRGRDELIKAVQTQAGHDRVAVVNTNWSFAGPKAVFPPNLATLFQLRDVQGYDSLFPGQYKRWLLEQTGQDPSPPEVGNIVFLKTVEKKVLDGLGARLVLSLAPLLLEGVNETQVEGVRVYFRESARGRAYVACSDGSQVGVSWLRDEPHRLALTVDLPAVGHLNLADQFWPGWKAYVDKTEVPLKRHLGIFRRVAVPAGRSTLEFRYEPSTTIVGIYLLMIGTCATTWCLVVGAARRARSNAGG